MWGGGGGAVVGKGSIEEDKEEAAIKDVRYMVKEEDPQGWPPI